MITQRDDAAPAPVRPAPTTMRLAISRPPAVRSRRRRSSPSRAPAASPSCGSKSPTNRPRSTTLMASESPISSSRSAEISSTASPLRRASRMWSQIAAWAPTSTPRVGCEATEQHRVAAHLAPHDELLLVAPGQRPRRGVDRGGAHVVLLDDALRCPCGRPGRFSQAPSPTAAGSGGPGCGSPTAGSRAADRSAAGPRGCSRCRTRGAPRRPGGDVLPGELARDRRSGWRIPMTTSVSSVWPLPSTPATPSTSPRWIRSETASSSVRPGRVGQRDVVELEHLLAGDRGLLGVRRRQLGADHELGELAGGHVGGAYGGHGRCPGGRR